MSGGGASGAPGYPDEVGGEPNVGVPRIGYAFEVADRNISPAKYPAFYRYFSKGMVILRSENCFRLPEAEDRYLLADRVRAPDRTYPERPQAFLTNLLTISVLGRVKDTLRNKQGMCGAH